jgi:hypothetical protein
LKVTSYLNHERHVPDPVQSHNGRRIKHPHLIAMDNFPYPDILCLGKERDLSQNGKKMTDQQLNKKIEKHFLP